MVSAFDLPASATTRDQSIRYTNQSTAWSEEEPAGDRSAPTVRGAGPCRVHTGGAGVLVVDGRSGQHHAIVVVPTER